jgi:phosphohistidine phosphatase SixA
MVEVTVRGRLLLGALILSVLAGSTGAQEKKPLADKELVEQLKKGGYVIYFRHCATNQDQADTDTLNLENTKAQRQLTDEGHEQGKAIGKAFKTLGIYVEYVLTSKFLRASETGADLNVGELKDSLDVTEPVNVSPNEAKRRAAELRKLLGTIPPERKNLIIVSHRTNLQDAVGKEVGDMVEGEAVVFKPTGKGFEMVARVKCEKWTEWAKNFGK